MSKETAQATPEAAATVTTPAITAAPVTGAEVKSALQYHEEAAAATEAYQNETDAAKKVELKKTAQELLTKTKESYKAEKEAAEKALADGKNKAPEKYDLKLPEKSLLTQASLDKISAIAKERGLSNEQAQAFVERESAAIAEDRQTQKAEFVKLNNGWFEELKSDKVFGGEKLAEADEKVSRFIDTFGTPEFKKELMDSGMGRHPGFFRMLRSAAEAMGEDKFIAPGAQAVQKEGSRADKFYPTTAVQT